MAESSQAGTSSDTPIEIPSPTAVSPVGTSRTTPDSNNTVTWNYEFHFPAIRDELNNAINRNTDDAVFTSDPFGPAGSQWCLKFQLVRERNPMMSYPGTRVDQLSAWCIAEKSQKEDRMGDYWFRIVYSMTLSLSHPQRPKLQWNFLEKNQIPKISDNGRLCKWELELEWARAPCDAQPPASAGIDFGNKLLFQSFLADVTLRDVSANDPRIDLPAHKVVLASRSPYFHALFSSGLSEATTSSATGQTTVAVNGFSRPTIERLLEFKYTKRLTRNPPNDLDTRFELIRAADYYQMEDLHISIAGQIIDKDLNMSTALKILIEANKCKGICSVLSDRVKEYLKSGWEEFMKRGEFRDSWREYGSGDLVAELYE
ncbi:Kelch-like H-associated protein 1 [Rhizophlyctis rosea]|nr:Kelch-like H-associated protein 1 [Rhizophlyctis rosea]